MFTFDTNKNDITFVIIDLSGAIVVSQHIHTPFSNTDEYFKIVGNLVMQTLEQHKIPFEKVLGTGIAVPAIVSQDLQKVSHSNVIDFNGGTAEFFSRYIPFPCNLCNDANAGGIAEMWNKSDMKNAFYLSLSKSVGGSVLLDNSLYIGENQRSCEIGHVIIVPEGRECYCGKKGCVDAYCNSNILSQCCGGDLSVFFNQLDKNNPTLSDTWHKYLYYLSIVIDNIRLLFDCNVILGGYVGEYIDKYVEQLRNMITERSIFETDSNYLQSCQYKHEAAAVGAALMHIEWFIKNV